MTKRSKLLAAAIADCERKPSVPTIGDAMAIAIELLLEDGYLGGHDRDACERLVRIWRKPFEELTKLRSPPGVPKI